jgi:cell division cycle protein 37
MNYLRQCVHQGLLIQYCGKLGPDGVNLFFKRSVLPGPFPNVTELIVSWSRMSNPQAKKVFLDDVQATSGRIANRSREMAAERDASPGEEAIQLASTDPNHVITFDVPDGPPPENITLEGEGTEHLDPEEVKAFLQHRWDIFESFPKKFKEALKTNSLDEVNKILGKMAVDEAEEIVGMLDEAKILNFESTNIIDETKQSKEG